MLLRVSVGDEACLELIDGAAGLPLDGKNEVAMHYVGAGRHGGERNEVPRLESDEAGELLGNRLAPLLGLWARHRLPVALRNSEGALIGRQRDRVGAASAASGGDEGSVVGRVVAEEGGVDGAKRVVDCEEVVGTALAVNGVGDKSGGHVG